MRTSQIFALDVATHIGHDQRECPDEDLVGGGVHFGKMLRCSPQKKESGKCMTIPADVSGARRGLNFSGAQQKKAMSTASSSAGPQKFAQPPSRRRYREDNYEEKEDQAITPTKISDELVDGVKKLGMAQDGQLPGQMARTKSPERVSALDFFMDSSDASRKGVTESPN